MKQLLFFILVLWVNQDLFSQKKVKLRYEYDVEKDDLTKKIKKELYKIYKYDRSGFLEEITTYGMQESYIDTILIKRPDGSEEKKIGYAHPIDMKKIGRVEKFTRSNDSTIVSRGFEISNSADTFDHHLDTAHFERIYKKEAPNTYSVNLREIKYFDDEFEEKNSEQISSKKYDAQGRVSNLEFMTDNNESTDHAQIQYFNYNKKGALLSDSTINDGRLISKNKYKFNKLNRIIAQEKTSFFRGKYTVNIIHYIYDKQGMLVKKFITGKLTNKWMSEYKYEYY